MPPPQPPQPVAYDCQGQPVFTTITPATQLPLNAGTPFIVYDSGKAGEMPQTDDTGLPVQETDDFKMTVLPSGEIETERTYLVPWSIWNAWFLWAKGYETTIGGIASPGNPAPATLSRIKPIQDPVYTWLYADSVQMLRGDGAVVDDPNNVVLDATGSRVAIRPPPGQPQTGALFPLVARAVAFVSADQNSQLNFSDGYARARVCFRSRPYTVMSDGELAIAVAANPGVQPEMLRNVDWGIVQPSIQALPLAKVAGNGLVFTAGNYTGKVVPEAGVLLLQTQAVSPCWRDVCDPNWDTLDSCSGQVNSQTLYMGPGRTPAPPGTVLLLSYKSARHRNAVGKVVFDITLNLVKRIRGWNNFIDPDGNYNPVRFVGVNGTPANPQGGTPYTLADLSQIFVIGPPAQYP